MKLLILPMAAVNISDGDEQNPQVLNMMTALGEIHHDGWRIMLLAGQPDRWKPTRSSLDESLVRQRWVCKIMESHGIHVDGVYYVGRNFFSGRRQRVKAINEILARYGHIERAILMASAKQSIGAAEDAGIETRPLPAKAGVEDLIAGLNSLMAEPAPQSA